MYVLNCSSSHLVLPSPPAGLSAAEPLSSQVRPAQLMKAAAIITQPDWISAGEPDCRGWSQLLTLVANKCTADSRRGTSILNNTTNSFLWYTSVKMHLFVRLAQMIQTRSVKRILTLNSCLRKSEWKHKDFPRMLQFKLNLFKVFEEKLKIESLTEQNLSNRISYSEHSLPTAAEKWWCEQSVQGPNGVLSEFKPIILKKK